MTSATYAPYAFDDNWFGSPSKLHGSLASSILVGAPKSHQQSRGRKAGTYREITELGGFTNVIDIEAASSKIATSTVSDDSRVADGALAAIRSFGTLMDGWDGADAKAPSEEIVADALAVARSWPGELGAPAAEPDSDGHISLSGFDQDGMITLAIDFIGEGRATYAVLAGPSVLVADKFNPRSQTAVIRTLERARQILDEVGQ